METFAATVWTDPSSGVVFDIRTFDGIEGAISALVEANRPHDLGKTGHAVILRVNDGELIDLVGLDFDVSDTSLFHDIRAYEGSL